MRTKIIVAESHIGEFGDPDADDFETKIAWLAERVGRVSGVDEVEVRTAVHIRVRVSVQYTSVDYRPVVEVAA